MSRARIGTPLGIGFTLLLGLLLALAAWLYVSAPEPRAVVGWTVETPLSAPRGELATVTVHAEACPQPPCPDLERLLVIGGISGLGRVEAAVSVFDPREWVWRAAPELPAPRHHLGAAGLGEAVYVSGGAAGLGRPWQPEANLWRLRLGAAEWETLEPMPEPRWGHRMVAHDGSLYVVGGQGPSAAVLIYTEGEGWRRGAALPLQRDHLSVVVVAGRIWAIGGRAPDSLARVDIYDPAADRWSRGPDLPAPASGAAEGVVDDVILIVGGEEADLLRGVVYDRHWMLDTRAPRPQWQALRPPPLPVHGADGAVFLDTLFIAGGASRHGLWSLTAWTDTLQRFDPTVLTADRSPSEHPRDHEDQQQNGAGDAEQPGD